jgi:hypothetical protein
MDEYIVACHVLEIPYGCPFAAIPKFPYERNEFVLLNVEGWLIPGRWHPGENGPDYLKLPDLIIELTERVFYFIVGLIVPLDKQQTCWN